MNSGSSYPNQVGNLQDLTGMSGSAYHRQFSRERSVEWTSPRLARITRLRLLSDPGFPYWDVSYCHGELRDGTKVHVILPFSQLPKRNMRGAILAYAREDGVFAKRLGVFDAISQLW